jgi:hypothetical protein
MKKNSEIKKETELKISELRNKRKIVISNFRKKAEETKISQIKDSIFNK